jgi:hypothetical protein
MKKATKKSSKRYLWVMEVMEKEGDAWESTAWVGLSRAWARKEQFLSHYRRKCYSTRVVKYSSNNK